MLKLIQAGRFEIENPSVLPSGSDAVGLKLYAVPTVADVDGHDEGVGEALDRLLQEPRRERGRADHHPLGARVERRRHRRERAVPAADLQRQSARARDTLDESEARHARERTVEVDEVQTARSLRGEPACELDRVSSLECHGVALPSRKSYGTASEHVDRRDDLEITC